MAFCYRYCSSLLFVVQAAASNIIAPTLSPFGNRSTALDLNRSPQHVAIRQLMVLGTSMMAMAESWTHWSLALHNNKSMVGGRLLILCRLAEGLHWSCDWELNHLSCKRTRDCCTCDSYVSHVWKFRLQRRRWSVMLEYYCIFSYVFACCVCTRYQISGFSWLDVSPFSTPGSVSGKKKNHV